MRTSSILFATAPLLVLACTSHGEIANPNDPPNGVEESKSSLAREQNPVVSDDAKAKLVESSTAFALDLFKRSAKPSENLVQSPHSITTALGMLYAGAGTQTKTGIGQTLHVALPDSELHPALDWLDLQIASRAQDAVGKDGKPARVHVDNLLFGAEDATLGAPFLDTMAVSYGAGVQRVDFTKSDTLGLINGWVSDRTEARIPQLLQRIDPGTRLVLVDTVYVNAAWGTQFDSKDTRDEAFHAAGGDSTAPFMHKLDERQYAQTDAADVVELELSTKGLVLDVIVPKVDLASFEAAETPDSLAALWSSLQYGEVNLALPKFKLTPATNGSLKQQLSDLGMASAFSDGADFGPMMPNEPVHLLDVVHKTFFEVDETGLEAAAATAAILGKAQRRCRRSISASTGRFSWCSATRRPGRSCSSVTSPTRPRSELELPERRPSRALRSPWMAAR